MFNFIWKNKGKALFISAIVGLVIVLWQRKLIKKEDIAEVTNEIIETVSKNTKGV